MAITLASVRNIYLDANNLTDDQVQAHIDNATALVTALLSSTTYSQEILDIIGSYLTAHFLCLTYERGGLVRQKVGDSEDRYRDYSLDATGLSLTNYGQQALVLDTEGYLSTLASKALKAQFRVI